MIFLFVENDCKKTETETEIKSKTETQLTLEKQVQIFTEIETDSNFETEITMLSCHKTLFVMVAALIYYISKKVHGTGHFSA